MKLTITKASTILSASTTTLTAAVKVGLAASAHAHAEKERNAQGTLKRIQRVGQRIRGNAAAALDERSAEHGGAPRFEEGIPEAAAKAGTASAGHEHEAIPFGHLVECVPTSRSSGEEALGGADVGVLGCPDPQQSCVQDAESSLGGVCKSIAPRNLMPTPTTPITRTTPTTTSKAGWYCAQIQDNGCGEKLFLATQCSRECIEEKSYGDPCELAHACFWGTGFYEDCLKVDYQYHYHAQMTTLCVVAEPCKGYCFAYAQGYKREANKDLPKEPQSDSCAKGYAEGLAEGEAKGKLVCQSQIDNMCKLEACAVTEYCSHSHSANPEVFDA